METENEQVLEEVVVQEEESTPGEAVEPEETQEETVTLEGEEKAEFERWKAKKVERQKFAERAKSNPQPKKSLSGSELSLDTFFAIKDLTREEMEALKDESSNLGIPFEKYVSSQSGKNLLKSVRQEKKSQDSNQPLNSKSPVFKKFTQADLKGMTSKELEAILPHD